MIPKNLQSHKFFSLKREEDYHTHYIGRTQNGEQFLGKETFVITQGATNQEWEKSRKEYAVLYIIDNKGNHLKTSHRYAGKTAEISPDATRNILEKMINELGDVKFRDNSYQTIQNID